VVPRTKLPQILSAVGEIGMHYQLPVANVFHAGDGNLHPVVLYDEREEGVIERVRKAGEDILKLVCKVGGGLSGEHGIGIEKLAFMRDFFGEEDLDEMRRIRDLFNPRGLCNPGKAIPSAGRCVEPGPGKKLPIGH
jgi:glycolate oxidase